MDIDLLCTLKEDAARFSTRTEWQNSSKKFYMIAMKHGLIDECCTHMKVLRKSPSKERLMQSASGFSCRSAWKRAHPDDYIAARRMKILNECCAHMHILWQKKWNIDTLQIEVAKHSSRLEWLNNSSVSYNVARRAGILDQIAGHIPRLHPPWTEDEITEDASRFSTKLAWRTQSPAGYAAAQHRGIIDRVCAHMKKSNTKSVAEVEIKDFLSQYSTDISSKRIGKKELDIFLPSKSIAIEFNGLFWHTEENISGRFSENIGASELSVSIKRYHLDKTELAADHGISLVHIWEHEWMHRKEQVKNFLLSKIGAGKSIGARKCHFRHISVNEAKAFCEANHIQGASRSIELAIGAYHEDELIMVTTFSSHHRQGHPEKVLTRMCGKMGVHVAGGLSKMTKMAYEHFRCPLKTWVHRTLSDGSSYSKAGWKQVGILEPDYFYTKNKTVYSKQSMKKSEIKRKHPEVYSPEKTEAQMAKEAGYHRVWDCGKITFMYGGQ